MILPTIYNVLTSQEHRLLAREAVRKSLVLLKNGKDKKAPFLPLAKNAKRILVAGTHADDIGYQCGGWTIAWHGDSGKITLGKMKLCADNINICMHKFLIHTFFILYYQSIV